MRVLVCGGRDYSNEIKFNIQMDTFHAEYNITQVIEGGARGADALASRWGRRNKIPVVRYAADWRSYGSRAGVMRNQRIIDEGKPDYVIAFAGGRGTADMLKRAIEAKLPHKEFE